MNLIIVESPTKARTLGRFLGGDYQIDSTMGHVRDLPKSKLGVNIEKDFAPEYVAISKKRDAIKKIKEDAKKADKVFLATDPDREGEAIAYHVVQILSETEKQKNRKTKKQFLSSSVSQFFSLKRIVFHEITEGAVKEALAHAGEINMQLVDAQQARRVLDRLVGYKLSPLLWRKVRKGLSAGRVQSVAVRLTVEREREIEAFVPEEFWEIFAEVASLRVLPRVLPPASARPPIGETARVSGSLPPVSPAAVAFLAKLIEKDGEKIKIINGEQAKSAVADLEKSAYSVADIEKKEVVRRPSPPFTTSTMTQAAARGYFWSAKKTMSVAQKLYEEGLITYHRTDSMSLAKEAVFRARKFIEGEYGKDYLPEKPRFYKTKSKVAQEAHEAVRPTDVRITNHESRITSIGRDAEKLYGLIWKRFVACQMSDAVYDETTIDVVARVQQVPRVPQASDTRDTLDSRGTYTLRSIGETMKFPGWKKIYNGSGRETLLPDVEEGEALRLLKLDPQQKFTEPPARFSEATLVRTLEKLGIGRPSTYAPTISTIQDRQYVEKLEGKFHPTPLGISVNDFLLRHFPDVFDYKFTAQMEDDLDGIANGKIKWVEEIKEFWEPFSKKLEVVQEKAERVKVETEKTGRKCPKCKKGEQVIRVGRFGKFLSCSRFPDCDWTETYLEKLGMKCPECGEGEVIIRKTRRGKRFYGCSRYPACRWASWRKPKGKA